MTGIRRAAATAVLLLALPMSAVAVAPCASAAAPATVTLTASADTAAPAPASAAAELPRPTGRHAVGRDDLELVDSSRTDPWVPASGPRRLMVSVYYPARPGTGVPAPYMTPGAARALLDDKLPGNTVPTEVLTGVRTWSASGARPAPGRYPLVLLSPGFTMPRSTLTALAEDLSSHGYVVALIDHAYENTGTTFPDGSTLPCAACGQLRTRADWAALNLGRARDASFVVDRLTARPHPAWRNARMIDPSRVGVAGHSAGGAAAVPALLTDDRIRAGVDIDGTMDYAVPDSGIGGKPFLMLGHPLPDGEDQSWTDAWPRLDGWKRWLTVAGTNHQTFTDLPVLIDALGLPDPDRTLPAARAVQLTRAYVRAFFDLQLKGVPQPLLDGPTPRNPEVAFHP
ncbi:MULTISPECIES: esterase [Kitasatospora]|uniref:Putative esterase n=1 Tax=Kitasatospora setae (strain ATCC 33774 / DSM 43861 / JCM 3304 / KCC A-0304 / NBRC 14216 / KM-6054) TaxID=452652 RepID=E4N117_KITSK|nr:MULTISPECIES: esterase [Kitasatospora]BAJ31851.1 putative esterase [Kitasatospora setae KM-6054]